MVDNNNAMSQRPQEQAQDHSDVLQYGLLCIGQVFALRDLFNVHKSTSCACVWEQNGCFQAHRLYQALYPQKPLRAKQTGAAFLKEVKVNE